MIKALVFSFLLGFSGAAFGAEADVILCKSTSGAEEYFSIDYLRALSAGAITSGTKNLDWDHAYYGIASAGFFRAGHAAAVFVQSERRRPGSYNAFNVWEEAAFGFGPSDFEQFRNILPAHCGAGSKALTVIQRRLTSTANIYNFDPRLRSILKEKFPLQYSFITIHHFFRNFTNDLERIFPANAALHKVEFWKTAQGQKDLAAKIDALIRGPAEEVSLCNRTNVISGMVEGTLKQPCEAAIPEALKKIESIDLSDLELQKMTIYAEFHLRKSDLRGLANLLRFSANNITWFGIALHEGFFAHTPRLKTIEIRNTRLVSLDRGLFFGLSNIHELNLNASDIDSISPGVFQNLFTKNPAAQTVLDLGGGIQGFKELNSTQVAGLENLKSLSFRNHVFLKKLGAGVLTSLKSLVSLDLANTGQGVSTEFPTQGLEIVDGLSEQALPNLRRLDFSQSIKGFDGVGEFARLEELNVSRSNNTSDLSKIEKFLALRTLNISRANFYLSGASTALSALKNLETLVAENTMFFSPASEPRRDFYVHDLKLPPSLKILKTCYFNRSAAGYGELLKSAFKNQVLLKIFVKDQCRGEWIEITK